MALTGGGGRGDRTAVLLQDITVKKNGSAVRN